MANAAFCLYYAHFANTSWAWVWVCKQLAIFNPPEAHSDHIKLEATQSQIQKSFLLAEQRDVEEKILYNADTFCKFCLVLDRILILFGLPAFSSYWH